MKEVMDLLTDISHNAGKGRRFEEIEEDADKAWELLNNL